MCFEGSKDFTTEVAEGAAFRSARSAQEKMMYHRERSGVVAPLCVLRERRGENAFTRFARDGGKGWKRTPTMDLIRVVELPHLDGLFVECVE